MKKPIKIKFYTKDGTRKFFKASSFGNKNPKIRRTKTTFKEFKKFLAEECWSVKAYKDGAYDRKILRLINNT